MAMTLRERPYSQFNFEVSWPGANNTTTTAGFQEVSGLGMEVTVAEYRTGNYKENEPMKISGMSKTPDITLKRGVIGSDDLYSWLDAVRKGKQDQLKNVTIKLMSEDREQAAPAQEWQLLNARPIKYTGPGLNAKGTDLAIEELVLAAEKMTMLT